MAGKIQKPYDQLQHTRGGRRRPVVLAPEATAHHDAAFDVAISAIGRAFGRGPIPKASTTPDPSTPPRGKTKRRYPPRAERRPSVAKAQIAADRPRDARGHFLPVPGSRRARIRAANAVLPDDLAALVGDAETLAAQETPQAG